MNLLDVGQDVLTRAHKCVPGAAADVFLVHSEQRMAEWSEGQPENRVVAASHGLGLRVIEAGRLGFSHTNRWDASAVDEAVRQAAAASRSTVPDPFLDVSAPACPASRPSDTAAVDLDLIDGSLTADGWDQRAAFLSGLEADVKKRDKRMVKVLRATYRENRSDVGLVNSRGIAQQYSGTSARFSLACVAVDQGETQIGYSFQTTTHYRELKPDVVVEKAVAHTLSLLGGKRIPSGRYDLVLDPFVGAEFLELLATALRADQVQKGKSFLASRLGQTMGSPHVTIKDNGRLPRHLGSAPFDAEGLPTQETVLIDRGMLKGFLYDGYTARKAKRTSTGNAGRASYKGMPEPEPTNFYWEPGPRSPDELIHSVQSGIYVRMILGGHTVDTISGDFSLGLMGEYIENGVRTHGVRGVTMAGNLLEVLKKTEALGSDMTFAGAFGSPTVWIRDISVGGA